MFKQGDSSNWQKRNARFFQQIYWQNTELAFVLVQENTYSVSY